MADICKVEENNAEHVFNYFFVQPSFASGKLEVYVSINALLPDPGIFIHALQHISSPLVVGLHKYEYSDMLTYGYQNKEGWVQMHAVVLFSKKSWNLHHFLPHFGTTSA